MPNRRTDPLLLGGKILTILMQVAMAIGAVALSGVIVAFAIYGNAWMDEFAADTGAAFPVPALIGAMLIGFALVAIGFFFFGKLRQIIGTVEEGDPFQPANADRLQAMGWLTLAAQCLLIPAYALGAWLAQYADEAENLDVKVDNAMDLEGILLAIVLFILARVFKHGTAMRDDLEGTV